MTTRQLIDFYLSCTIIAAIAAWQIGLIACIAAFAGTAIAQTYYSENIRKY